jgi:hypothetical protein
MRTIAERNVLLLAQAELPAEIKLTTDEFCEGWSFVRSSDARRFGKKIRARGWNFLKISDGSLRSGVGDTSQEAIAGALKLALRQLNGPINSVEVENIELTKYPWFFLARVRISLYRVQQEAELPAMDELLSDPIPSQAGQTSHGASELSPDSGGPVTMLKELLLSSTAA